MTRVCVHHNSIALCTYTSRIVNSQTNDIGSWVGIKMCSREGVCITESVSVRPYATLIRVQRCGLILDMHHIPIWIEYKIGGTRRMKDLYRVAITCGTTRVAHRYANYISTCRGIPMRRRIIRIVGLPITKVPSTSHSCRRSIIKLNGIAPLYIIDEESTARSLRLRKKSNY